MTKLEETIQNLDITQQDFYKSITNLLNITTYNEHKFHIPTTTPKLKIPNSQLRNGWTEEKWFESLVQKIYLRLNYQTQFSLDRIGGFTNIKEQKLLWLIIKAFCIQIELMVYNGVWATVLDTGSINLPSGTFSANEVIDDFWFTEPYAIFKSIGLINEWGFTEIDKDGAFDFTEFATKKYVDNGDDMSISVSANYTNERVQESISYINNIKSGIDEYFKEAYNYIDKQDNALSDKIDKQDKEIYQKIDDIEVETFYQKTDNDGNSIGDKIRLGRTVDIVITGISQPLYDPLTKTMTLETVKEVPSEFDAQLSNTPVSTENGGDNYGITASWAFTQVPALSVSSDIPNTQVLTQLAKNIYGVEFIDEAPLVEVAPLAITRIERSVVCSHTNDRIVDEPIEPIKPAHNLTAEDPLRVFQAIKNGMDLNDILGNIYNEQIRIQKMLEPTVDYVGFQ